MREEHGDAAELCNAGGLVAGTRRFGDTAVLDEHHRPPQYYVAGV
jgi:hypothetical protein